jgi:hypothetical protein
LHKHAYEANQKVEGSVLKVEMVTFTVLLQEWLVI